MKCFDDAELARILNEARRAKTEADVHAFALELVADAERLGVVLTVEQAPRLPLAMGNHETFVSIRPARVMA